MFPLVCAHAPARVHSTGSTYLLIRLSSDVTLARKLLENVVIVLVDHLRFVSIVQLGLRCREAA